MSTGAVKAFDASDLARAWNSGYWHGTTHAGPLNDAAINAKNPYLTADADGCMCGPREVFNETTGDWDEHAGCTGQCN